MTAAAQRRRILTAGRTPARALQALAELSVGLAANDAVNTAALQRALHDERPSGDFRTFILRPLVDRGLAAETLQGRWRLTAEGMHMLKALDAAPPPRRSAAPLAPDVYVGQIVPPAQINRLAGHYDKDECNFRHVRAGALDYRDLPSRRGNVLVYRDGRTVPVDHANSEPVRPRTPNAIPEAPPAAAPAVPARRRRAA